MTMSIDWKCTVCKDATDPHKIAVHTVSSKTGASIHGYECLRCGSVYDPNGKKKERKKQPLLRRLIAHTDPEGWLW